MWLDGEHIKLHLEQLLCVLAASIECIITVLPIILFFFLSKCPPGMKQQVLTFYTKLLAHIRQPLLPHINVHRPVQVSCHSVCGCPLFIQTIGNVLVLFATVALLLLEIDPPVRWGSGSPHGKRRDPVPLYSLCQTQAGPVPCQLLPGGRSFNRRRPTTTASL